MLRALSVIALLSIYVAPAVAERGVRALPARRLANRAQLHVEAPSHVRRQVANLGGAQEVLNTSMWARHLASRRSLIPKDAHPFLPTELPGNLVDVRFDADGRNVLAVEYFPFEQPGARTHTALVERALTGATLILPSELPAVRRALAEARPINSYVGVRTGDLEIVGQLIDNSFSFVRITRRILPEHEFRTNTGWWSPTYTISNQTPK